LHVVLTRQFQYKKNVLLKPEGQNSFVIGSVVHSLCSRWQVWRTTIIKCISCQSPAAFIFIASSFWITKYCKIKRQPDKWPKGDRESACQLSEMAIVQQTMKLYLKFCSPCILRKFVDSKPTWCTKFLKYIYLSVTLYMFRALCAHHQERSNCTNTTSVLVIPFSCVPCEHYRWTIVHL
jgi:hypothetical protein